MGERLLDSDFVMIQIMTPFGDPTYISESAFLNEKDELKGLNFWSPDPNQIKQQIQIGGEKMKRPISDHIIAVLTKNDDKTYNFKDLQVLLTSAGYKHSPGMIKDNLEILLKDGKVTKCNDCFGITKETPA